MTKNAQLSGVDLARVALCAAKVAAQKNGGGRTVQPKPDHDGAQRRFLRRVGAVHLTAPALRWMGQAHGGSAVLIGVGTGLWL
ncbi:hypothetical protein [Streptomyces griseoluteus]|uniref:hypothetical protein n=1 Tax=Streptomyces griseoluteus TaxID=29306 RepID=UPI0036AD1A04